MYPVPMMIADWLRKPYREFTIKAEVDGVEYDEDVIVDFSIENSLSLSDELELGTVIPSKLTIRFRMQSGLPPNAKIIPYIALLSDGLTWDSADMTWDEADIAWEGGPTEWLPLGEFYVDTRSKDRDVWTYVCLDKLVFADVAYVSELTYPTTMQAVWDEICDQVGFTYDSSVDIDPSYTIGAGPAGYTCRQVMGFIASANSACAYLDKVGILKFKRLSASTPPVFEMGESDYVRAKQTNPIKTYSRVVVIYDQDDGLYYEAGSGDESQTLYIDNPLGTQQMANDILSQINGLSYTPISMPARGYPQLEQGDVISFEATESLSWEDADIAWDDADIPWDGAESYQTIILHQVLDFKGGLAMQIEAPSVSEQESEFGIDGSLTAAVKRLNENAVRYGKPYYGVSHSRTEGIVVQREDGLAKAVFNADELSFYAESERALWFDVPNRRYKFSGIVEASSFLGGDIAIGSGNNVFKADTRGIWSGHSNYVDAPFYVNMQGQLYATDANITGTITGSAFEGGSITGALIQTALPGIYPRIEFSSTTNVLNAYTDTSNSLSIQASYNAAPSFVFIRNGNAAGLIQATISELSIIGLGRNLRLSSTSDVELNGSLVRVPSWSRLFSNDSSQTLQAVLNSKPDAGIGTTIFVLNPDGVTTTRLQFVRGVLVSIS